MQQGLIMTTSSSSSPSSLHHHGGFDHQSSDEFLQQFLNVPSCTWTPADQNDIVDPPSFRHFDESSSFNNHHLHHHHSQISPDDDPNNTMPMRLMQQHQDHQTLLMSNNTRSSPPSAASGDSSGLVPLPLSLNHPSHLLDDHLIDACLLNNGFTTGSQNNNNLSAAAHLSSDNPNHHFLHQGVSIPNFGGSTANNLNGGSTANNLNGGLAAANGTTPGGGAASQPQPRQRIRARRGQATDPHSIAERLRRERIAERMKALQELVPNANKTDKASMLDEIIDYVKFLQLQVKVLSMSRLGGGPPVSPLERGAHGGSAAHHSASTKDNGMSVTEHQVAKLMEEDMGSAMQYLQGKGLCLMPISLATAISTATSHSRTPFPNKTKSNGEGPSSPNMSALTIQSALTGNNASADGSIVKDNSASKA